MKKTLSLFLLLTLIFLSSVLVSCDIIDLESLINLDQFQKEEVFYTVTFDSKGGTPIEAQSVKSGDGVHRPTQPSREGYEFDGWYYEDEKWSFFENRVYSDITIEAVWVPKVKVTFETDKGDAPQPQYVGKGFYATEPTAPEASGYLFDGWYFQDIKWDFENNKISDDITLEARFIKLLRISLDFANGLIDKEYVEIVNGDMVGTLPSPVRTGYIFRGWYLPSDKNFYNPIQESTTFDVDTTLVARWEKSPDSVAIKLDVNGGRLLNFTPPYILGTINSKIGELPKPEAPLNGSFIGWYDDKTNTRYSTNIVVSGEITLTARYQFESPCPVTGNDIHAWTNWYYPLSAPTCTEDHYGEKKCMDCGLVHYTFLEDARGHYYEESWTTAFMSQSRQCQRCDNIQTVNYVTIDTDNITIDIDGNVYGSEYSDCLFNGNWDDGFGSSFCGKDGSSVTVNLIFKEPTLIDCMYIKGAGGYTFIVYGKREGENEKIKISSSSFSDEPTYVKLGGSYSEISIELPSSGYGDGYWQEILLAQKPGY